MPVTVDPVTVTNLVLAAIILVMGLWFYTRTRGSLALFVAVGFGLFGVSHALTILGYGGVDIVIIPIRVLGYLTVIAGLVVAWLRD